MRGLQDLHKQLKRAPEHSVIMHAYQKSRSKRLGGIFLRPSTKTIGCIDEQNRILAACSLAGSDHVSAELLYKNPGAAHGMGRVALGAALEFAYNETRCESVGIVVREENARMLRLCHEAGFHAIEHIQGKPWSLRLLGRDQVERAIVRLTNLAPNDNPHQSKLLTNVVY